MSFNCTQAESQFLGNGGHPLMPFPPEVAVWVAVDVELVEPTKRALRDFGCQKCSLPRRVVFKIEARFFLYLCLDNCRQYNHERPP